MKRSDVIQQILLAIDGKRYLEIGVNRGVTFHEIAAECKVAVDPKFLFDHAEAGQQNASATYFQMTSDEYFAAASGQKFDVIYLDGLHTFDQTLRDLMNALSVLNDTGIVVIDDVIPNSYAASLPDLGKAEALKAATGDADMSWMGDVYRVVYFIESFMPMYSYATIQENHGQAVMWRSSRFGEPIEKMSLSGVASVSFADVATNKQPLRIRPFAEILREINNARQEAANGQNQINAAGAI